MSTPLNRPKSLRAVTAIFLVVTIALVLISPITDLEAAVHHRSHHSPSLSLWADTVLALLVGLLTLVESRKTVHERAVANRQPALLRC